MGCCKSKDCYCKQNAKFDANQKKKLQERGTCVGSDVSYRSSGDQGLGTTTSKYSCIDKMPSDQLQYPIYGKNGDTNEVMVMCPKKYMQLLNHVSGNGACGCDHCKDIVIPDKPAPTSCRNTTSQCSSPEPPPKKSHQELRTRAEIYSMKGGKIKWKMVLSNTMDNNVVVNQEVYDETPGLCVSDVCISPMDSNKGSLTNSIELSSLACSNVPSNRTRPCCNDTCPKQISSKSSGLSGTPCPTTRDLQSKPSCKRQPVKRKKKKSKKRGCLCGKPDCKIRKC